MRIRKIVQAAILLGACAAAAPAFDGSNAAATTANGAVVAITISGDVPNELNPTGGGAPNATPEQAAAFAWQEFIALNWPTLPGAYGREKSAYNLCKFGNLNCVGPLVWETMRSKVETFPGNNQPPPGFTNQSSQDYGYDAPVRYNYADGAVDGPCDPAQASDTAPFINLDETDQITLNNMYAGVVQGGSAQNSQPKLIRFLAKSNRKQYIYVAKNQWWNVIPRPVTLSTRAYLATNQASPPPEMPGVVSQPFGTIEVKAGWRQLNNDEISGGRFHTARVRYYEQHGSGFAVCWRDATWGLVSLHIIQKTPTAPYFIYATFEHADNILTADGLPVEDEDGNIIRRQSTATTPQVCLNDQQPHGGGAYPNKSGYVTTTADPAACQTIAATYCTNPGKRIYYHNVKVEPPPPPPVVPANGEPSGGDICVNQRVNEIPLEIRLENKAAHDAMKDFGVGPNSPWLAYKLVNVQYYPYDKIPTSAANGSPYNYGGPYDARHPSPASYYLANILVETNRSLQQFSGGLSPNIATDWDANGDRHKNTYYNGTFYNMGGCMGCHGSQGQNPTTNPGGDFSVILSRGGVITPEIPVVESSAAVKNAARNRSLSP
jgi:hypothetical protein